MSAIAITVIVGIILGLVGSVLYGVGLYNSLVRVRHNVDQAWANIDVLLKQRSDELPKLIDAVKGYLSRECC